MVLFPVSFAVRARNTSAMKTVSAHTSPETDAP